MEPAYLRGKLHYFRRRDGGVTIALQFSERFPSLEALAPQHGEEILITLQGSSVPSVTLLTELPASRPGVGDSLVSFTAWAGQIARTVRTLLSELGAYGRVVDVEHTQRLVQSFTTITRWMREAGHGRVIVSAVDHRPGTKIEFQTLHSIKEK